MTIKSVLIANRGEIAIRIARACAELGLRSVGVHSMDDAASLHVRRVDQAVGLPGVGPAAYLDAEALVEAAIRSGCEAVHPGYGFLAENAGFARACEARGLVFVGPSPEALEVFGDKVRARELAASLGAPLAPGTRGGASLEEIGRFREQLGAGASLIIKAVAGGGGRGMRKVAPSDDLAQAYELCTREAQAAFGDGALYAEQLITQARHVEVQVVADGREAICVHERECSVQRRHQKLIEIAPAPALSERVREALRRSAARLATACDYRGLATFEFLVSDGPEPAIAFMEANARLQVEHTVTEAVTGLDLVQIQLRIAQGESLADLGLAAGPPAARGYAVQLRVNLETLASDGAVTSEAGGRISLYEPPSGPGVRVDGYGYGGYVTSAAFDSLIAKVIVHSASPDLGHALAKARRAAEEFRITGVETNLPLIRAILERPEVADASATTTFLEDNIGQIAARALELRAAEPAAAEGGVDTQRSARPQRPGAAAATAGLRATIVSLEVVPGQSVRAGQQLAVLEAMKMQHLVLSPVAGEVLELTGAVGETIDGDWPLVFIAPGADADEQVQTEAVDLDHIRPDLAEVIARHALTLDAARPDAVARRRRTGQRTARENLADLFDPGSFSEVGAMAVAAQRRRRSLEDLQKNTPADGIITGVGSVNGEHFDEARSRCVGLAYDFTVLAGTQGAFNHKKTDRILEFAEHWKAPVIWYTEGGGGRPGDVDGAQMGASSLDTTSFTTFARLSGVAPRISINSGRCFAGNAIFFGCADVTIATRYSNIGLGGPAMIEGGGLGVYTPDEIGPSDVLFRNGVIDVLVDDEAEATAAAKQILSVFQGPIRTWTCADQRTLRHLIPENRVRAYDVRQVIRTLADEGSFVELRGGYGPGMITAFIRIEGRPLGLIANDPRHLGGAIDAEGAEKAGRFMQLCDAFDVPILSLCDTPGFMVGPQSEEAAAVRRGSRMLVSAASISVPLFALVLRKGYGLGAQAMTGGDFSAAALTIAWPTAEFGPMGLEGAVRLGYRKELDAEPDPAARQALFEKLVGRMYENGKALSVASVVEIDAVIDPAETRAWIIRGLRACQTAPRVPGKKRPFVDVW